MKILKIHEECKYCRRKYNKVWATYCTLTVKLLAPTLFNIEKVGQNKEFRIKPTMGDSISYYQ